MGSKPVDSGQMKTAGAGADAAAAAQAGLAKQQTQYLTQAHDTLFGADGKSGTLGGFLDPSKLDVTNPTGVYLQQYKDAAGNIAKGTQAAQGAVQRNLASRGFGNAPAGFAEDQARQTQLAGADAQGKAFTDAQGGTYQDALNKFWNATNLASGNAATSTQAAVNANSSAGGIYGNLYGHASEQVQSPWGALGGAALQGAGTVGAAALCPVKGSLILMADGKQRLIEDLKQGDELMGADEQICTVKLISELPASAVEIITEKGNCKVSASHTFMLSRGGYVVANEAKGALVEFENLSALVAEVKPLGELPIFPLELDASHSYCVDGFWSLS